MKHLPLKRYQEQASYSVLCGHRIAYWQSIDFQQNADLETIVFIHGFPSASWDWHFQWKNLARQYRLVSLDLLGFGLSDKPKKHQYSLLQQADIVQSLLKELGIKHYHILAHDYGDSVAQELLSREHNSENIAKIRSLCFLNGGLFAAYHRPLFTQKLLKSKLGGLASYFMNKTSFRKSFSKIFSSKTPPSAYEIDILWQLLEHNQGKRVLPKLLSYLDDRVQHGQRWLEHMQSTKTPLYFINGVHDPISGQHMLDRYNEVMPNARSTALDVGHYPQLEAPQQVLALYRTFLEEVLA